MGAAPGQDNFYASRCWFIHIHIHITLLSLSLFFSFYLYLSLSVSFSVCYLCQLLAHFC